MKAAIAMAVAIILVAASLPYGYHIARGHVVPALSTWMIFGVATSLQATSYLVATGGAILSRALGWTEQAALCHPALLRATQAWQLCPRAGHFRSVCRRC